MKYVEAGGVRLSAIGLGTWQFGSGEWAYGKAYAESEAPAIVARSLECGVNLIDTAEIYGFGRSERIVGRAIGPRRDEVFLATKLFPVVPVDPVVRARARASLGRLGTESIDLYQIHWPNPVFSLRATMKAMGALQHHRLVRHVGVSNFSLSKWRDAEGALEGPVLSNQVRYSLLDRRCEREILPWAQENDRVVIAYSPLAQGLLSGRYDAEHRPGGLRARTAAFLPENLARLAPLLGVLGEVAEAHGASRAQVALAWLIRRPNVVVIPGASSVAQAEANAQAAEIALEDAEDEALTAASAGYHPTGGLGAIPAMIEHRVGQAGRRVRAVVHGLRA